MTTGLEVLPRFRVATVSTLESGDVLAWGELEGWDPANGPKWLWLWLSDEQVVTPMVVDEGQDVALQIAAEDIRAPVRAGASLPWLHSYWQAYHVAMIRNGEWQSRAFVARDALHFELGGAHGWNPVEGGLPEGAVSKGVEPGGWDHEHCEICNARIGHKGSERGYVDSDDHWLCPDCYKRWAEPRDYGFLVGRT